MFPINASCSIEKDVWINKLVVRKDLEVTLPEEGSTQHVGISLFHNLHLGTRQR